MTDKNLEEMIMELKEMKAMKREVKSEIAHLENELKEEMKRRSTGDLSVGIHRLTYKSITSRRFDSKALRAENEEIYNKYLKVKECMRFTVA